MTKPQAVSKDGAAGPWVVKAPSMRAPLKKAIDEIVFKGRTQRAAAEIVGYNETSLGRALQRPQIAAWVEHLKTLAVQDANRLSKQARAIAINEGMRLMVEAQSEQVRARMVEFFARGPSQPLVNFSINSPAASTYTFTKRTPPDSQSGSLDAQAIDVTPQSDQG